MSAENTVGLSIRKDFHKALGGEICFRATIAHKRKLAGLVSSPCLFQLLFGFANGGDLRMRVDHTGDHIIVHMTGLPSQKFRHGHAFIFGLMRQHGARNCVANSVNTSNIGGIMRIGLDLPALSQGDAKRVQSEAVDIGASSRGDKHHIGLDLMLAVLFAFDIRNSCFAFFDRNRLHCCAHGELKALFFENSEEGFLDLTIHAGGDLIQKFNDLNLSAQPRVDRSQFQTNDTGADHHQFARNFVQRQSACGGYDGFFVDRNSRQARGL